MRSIFGKIADLSAHYRTARVQRGAGWKGGYKRGSKITGYHRQMPLADLKALALKLQRDAR
jgi:hypothetical protein